MKQLLKPLRNWRTWVLTILAGIAAIVLLGETESTTTFIAGKAIGVVVCVVIYLLARYWDARNLIPELAELVSEDEC